jgi:hypothetical protein
MQKKQSSRIDPASIVPVCYHCGVRKLNLAECDIWGIKVCPSCIQSLHVPHHQSCRKDAPKKQQSLEMGGSGRTAFSLRLTHYSGRPLFLDCHRGTSMLLEEHWAGTYILFASGMILVLEDKQEINQLIIEGLKSLSA